MSRSVMLESRSVVPTAARSAALAPSPSPVPAPSPAPAPAPALTPAPPAQVEKSAPIVKIVEDYDDIKMSNDECFDFTEVPGLLDKRYEALDEENALRPTILSCGSPWKRQSQKSLLSKPIEETLDSKAQDSERDKAFDLLDALSRSGSLTVDEAELHVVIAATHCFDETLTNTIIKQNKNPIEKVECSNLIIGTTIQDKPLEALVKPDHVLRIESMFPKLLNN
jgi:hypothetical protein